jgi:hypothetical protein
LISNRGGVTIRKFKNFTIELKNRIATLEKEAEITCEKVYEKFLSQVRNQNCDIEISFNRLINNDWSKPAASDDCFKKGYCSEITVSIGLVDEPEAQDHLFISIWECKTQFFRKIGILYEEDISECEKEMEEFIRGFLESVKEEE